jgi:hypothetical protein
MHGQDRAALDDRERVGRAVPEVQRKPEPRVGSDLRLSDVGWHEPNPAREKPLLEIGRERGLADPGSE